MAWANAFGFLAAGFGAALAAMAAGMGIGKIAVASVESMARQPEASGDIRGAMILTAALIEGVAFFAAIVCLLIWVKIDLTVGG